MNDRIPSHLLYTRDHEWFDPATGKVGITHFAQNQLGDIVYVDLEKPATVGRHDKIGTVESVKTVSDIYSPLAGTIVEINTALNASPEVINTDAYGAGWMVRYDVATLPSDFHLLPPSAYASLIG